MTREEVQSLSSLQETVERLADELRVLRDSIDELREIVEWIGENPERCGPVLPHLPLLWMPRDPLDPQWGKRVQWGRSDRESATNEPESDEDTEESGSELESPAARGSIVIEDKPKSQPDLFRSRQRKMF